MGGGITELANTWYQVLVGLCFGRPCTVVEKNLFTGFYFLLERFRGIKSPEVLS